PGRIGDLVEGLAAVAPDGMHLKVAAVVGERGALEPLVAKRRDYFRPRQKVATQPAALAHVARLSTRRHGFFDGRGLSRAQHLEHDLLRLGTNVRNLPERAVRAQIALNGLVQIENRRRRALVAPLALLRRLNGREIAQKGGNFPIRRARHVGRTWQKRYRCRARTAPAREGSLRNDENCTSPFLGTAGSRAIRDRSSSFSNGHSRELTRRRRSRRLRITVRRRLQRVRQAPGSRGAARAFPADARGIPGLPRRVEAAARRWESRRVSMDLSRNARRPAARRRADGKDGSVSEPQHLARRGRADRAVQQRSGMVDAARSTRRRATAGGSSYGIGAMSPGNTGVTRAGKFGESAKRHVSSAAITALSRTAAYDHPLTIESAAV